MELSLIEREVISYSCNNLLFCCFGFGVFLGNSHYILGKFYSLTVVSFRSTCVIPRTYQHYQINSPLLISVLVLIVFRDLVPAMVEYLPHSGTN